MQSGSIVPFEMSTAREPLITGDAVVGLGSLALPALPALGLRSRRVLVIIHPTLIEPLSLLPLLPRKGGGGC